VGVWLACSVQTLNRRLDDQPTAGAGFVEGWRCASGVRRSASFVRAQCILVQFPTVLLDALLVTGRRRLRAIAEPAKEAKRALAQGFAAEQRSHDDRENHYDLDEGDDFTEHGMEYPDADWGSQRGNGSAHRPPRDPCTIWSADGPDRRLDARERVGLLDTPVTTDREIVAGHARAPLRGSIPVPNSGRLRRGSLRAGN
jgi:hypothetical protein